MGNIAEGSEQKLPSTAGRVLLIMHHTHTGRPLEFRRTGKYEERDMKQAGGGKAGPRVDRLMAAGQS